MYKIQKGFPETKIIRKGAPQRKYPFADMEVGDVFVVPDRDKNTLSAHVSAVAKKLRRKFNTRFVYAVLRSDGKWAPVEEGTKGAKPCVRVRRVK